MSGSASEHLAQRYSLQLSPAWQGWFDRDADRHLLAGQFHSPVDHLDLLEQAPPDLWPGFMLPDTLPLVSNDYGDWWCMRIGADSQITEVIQWLHGGGDWLPVGESIAQAALWDYVQRWHNQAIGAQAAAHEFPLRSPHVDLDVATRTAFEDWLASSLHDSPAELRDVVRSVEGGEYQRALEQMIHQGWSRSAAACELVELSLQGSLTLLAETKLANRCGINWTPEYTSWLFDTARISLEARRMLCDLSPAIEFTQDWDAAGRWAERTRAERSDLSWAGQIAGWSAERAGDTQRAIGHYFDNRYASAFTDQSVRLRSHWFPERYGKFCVAQLARLHDQLAPAQQDDAYLQILWNEPAQRTRTAVREFWLGQARAAFDRHEYAAAYTFFTNAGWDLGAERLSDYVQILDGLVASAQCAGWTGRALVAAAHADCLRGRLPPT